MKVTSVYYQRTFPLERFINEHIGVTVTVDEGEDPKEALKIAKKWVEREHIKGNPQLYPPKAKTGSTSTVASYENIAQHSDDVPTIQDSSDRIILKEKAKPDIITIKKIENATKKGDVKTVEEILENYLFQNGDQYLLDVKKNSEKQK